MIEIPCKHCQNITISRNKFGAFSEVTTCDLGYDQCCYTACEDYEEDDRITVNVQYSQMIHSRKCTAYIYVPASWIGKRIRVYTCDTGELIKAQIVNQVKGQVYMPSEYAYTDVLVVSLDGRG